MQQRVADEKCRDHPLALYVFSNDAAFKKRVFDNTQSGSAIANECNIHVAGLLLYLLVLTHTN